ncbi:hypothetical protein CON36_31905 [Bacillus cereus]|uniref:Uncharacterized protein n=1 Tax=Bacillus cereus TaxID=1396 RepID=A0A9X6SU18_BACCE|nr:hypothetical protein [Bacillus cereus]PDZ94793.1 hypothetical protein CON36_31905 [Bacillus cereus]
MTTTHSLNIRPYMIMALGTNEMLRDDINSIFKEKETEYYAAFKNSDFYEDVRFRALTTEPQEQLRNVAGIVEYSYNKGDMKDILKLIKKGYNFVFRYVQSNQVVRASDLLAKIEKRKGDISNTSEQEIVNALMIAMYLCVQGMAQWDTRDPFNQKIGIIEEHILVGLGTTVLLDKVKSEYESQLPQYRERYNPNKKKKLSIGILLEHIVMKEITNHPDCKKVMTMKESTALRSKVFHEGISSRIGSLTAVIQMYGAIETEFFEKVYITAEELDYIFMLFLQMQEKRQFTEQDADWFVISSLYIKGIFDEYRHTQRKYLDDSKEEFYLTLLDKEKALQEQERHLIQQKQFEEKQRIQLSNELHQSKEENKQLELENQKLKKELESREDNKKELISLRDFMYRQMQDEPDWEEEEVPFDELVSYLNTKKIAFFGGHQTLHQKLKELLPNARFVHPDVKLLDVSFVDNMDAVFIQWKYFNHRLGEKVKAQLKGQQLYERVMKQMNQNKTSMFYIPVNNIELTIKEMATLLEKEEKVK